MQVSAHSQIKLDHVPTQYTIYAYDKYCGDVIGYNKWQCLLNSEDKKKVLAEAERLFQTDKFQKIEVKEKVFNPKEKKHRVSTCHVLDNQPKRNALLIGAFSLLTFSAVILLVLEML